MPLVLLLACSGGSDDIATYRAALDDGRCGRIADPWRRDDCWVHRTGVEQVPHCDEVTDPRLRGECWFVLAEATVDPSVCPKATPFADDCALHVLSLGFRALGEPGTEPGAQEGEVARRIAAAGLAPDDLRPWSAWYRQVLSGQRPLDRGSCAAVTDPARADACRRTGLALYQDRLNHARDNRLWPCEGGPLPASLTTTPDAEIDALVASRSDLCPAR